MLTCLPSGRDLTSTSTEPLTPAESALELLQAGFDPRDTAVLSRKIENVIKVTMRAFLLRYKIPVAGSFEAYIIPGERIRLLGV